MAQHRTYEALVSSWIPVARRCACTLWMAGALVAAGCAGSQQAAPPPQAAAAPAPPPPAPVHEKGSGKLIVEMGPAGGVLELEDGSRVEIPSGALEDDVKVTFAEGQHTTAFDNREWEKPLGRTLDLTPPVETQTPIKVSIPVASLPEGFEPEHLTLAMEVVSDQQRGVQGQGIQTYWDYSPAKQVNGRVMAELPYIPGMRLQFLVSRDE